MAILGCGPEAIAFPKKSNSLCITLPAIAGNSSANPTSEGWHLCAAAKASFTNKSANGDRVLTILLLFCFSKLSFSKSFNLISSSSNRTFSSIIISLFFNFWIELIAFEPYMSGINRISILIISVIIFACSFKLTKSNLPGRDW